MIKYILISLAILLSAGCSQRPTTDTLDNLLPDLAQSIVKSKLLEQKTANQGKEVFKLNDNSMIIFSPNIFCLSNQKTCFPNEQDAMAFFEKCGKLTEYFAANFYDVSIVSYTVMEHSKGTIAQDAEGDYQCNSTITLSVNVKQAKMEPGVPVYSLTPPDWNDDTPSTERMDHIRGIEAKITNWLSPTVDHSYIYSKSNQPDASWNESHETVQVELTFTWNKQTKTWENTNEISDYLENWAYNIPLLKAENMTIENIASSRPSNDLAFFNNRIWINESLKYRLKLDEGLIYSNGQWMTKDDSYHQNLYLQYQHHQLNHFQNVIMPSDSKDFKDMGFKEYQDKLNAIDHYLQYSEKYPGNPLTQETINELDKATRKTIEDMIPSLTNNKRINIEEANKIIGELYNKLSNDPVWKSINGEDWLTTLSNTSKSIFKSILKNSPKLTSKDDYRHILAAIDDYMESGEDNQENHLTSSDRRELYADIKEMIYKMLSSLKDGKLPREDFNAIISDFRRMTSANSALGAFFDERVQYELKQIIQDKTAQYLNQAYSSNIAYNQENLTIDDFQSYLNQISWFLDKPENQALGMDDRKYSELRKDISNNIVKASELLFNNLISKLDADELEADIFKSFIAIIDQNEHLSKDDSSAIKSQCMESLKKKVSRDSKAIANKLKTAFPPDDINQKIKGLERIMELLANLYKANLINKDEYKTFAFSMAKDYCNLECKRQYKKFDERELQRRLNKLRSNTAFEKQKNAIYEELKRKYRPYKKNDPIKDIVNKRDGAFIAYYPQFRKVRYRGEDGRD